MKRHWQYLKYVMKHKWFVFLACLELGVPLWIAIFHDWDKFLPDEWFAYVNNFYGEPLVIAGRARWIERGCPIGANLRDIEYEIEAERQDAFAKAWLLHQNRNKHHWQYWMITWDKGHTECLPMSDKYRREMLADWRGAGKAITGKDDTRNWYLKNRHNMHLHPDTRAWVEQQLDIPPVSQLSSDDPRVKSKPKRTITQAHDDSSREIIADDTGSAYKVLKKVAKF